MSTLYEETLTSPRWRHIGHMLRAYHQGCQACGSPHQLQVHHAHYDTLGNEQPQDLVLLCDDCHVATHTYDWPSEEIEDLRAENPRLWRLLH